MPRRWGSGWRALALGGAATVLSACALFSPRATTPSAPAPGPRIASEELRLERVLAREWTAAQLERWTQTVNARADGVEPRRAQRGELVTGLLVAARIDALAAPSSSEWALQAAAALSPCGTLPVDAACFARRVREDFRGIPEAEAYAALVTWAWGATPDAALASAETPETARVAALLTASVGADALAVQPVGDAGWPVLDALAPRTAIADAAALQHAATSDWVAAGSDALAAIDAGCRPALPAPWVEALAPRAARVCATLDAARLRLPIRVDEVQDITLQLARAFDEAPVSTAPPFERVVIVRSTGVEARLRPSLVWRDGVAVEDPPPERQSQALLAFEGPGMVPVDALVAGRLPAVTEALAAFEQATGQTPGPVSLLVDGNTYFASLRPILWALHEAGYGPIVLHLAAADRSRFAAAPVTLVPESDATDTGVYVRQDGYLVSGASDDALAPPHSVSRTGRAPLLELVRYLETVVAADDAAASITLRVDDGTADVGSLMHVLSAIAWRRDTALLYDDLGLLRAEPIVYAGVPAGIAPGGVRLAF